MDLLYDERDDAAHRSRGSDLLYWLDDLGAKPLAEAGLDATGFLFAGARPMADYRRLVESHPRLRDRPEEREPLIRLDDVLDALARSAVDVATPRTWRLPLDVALPADLTFPLFVRTALTTFKRGGHASRVRTPAELRTEMEQLRRAVGWDAVILAREWCDLAPAGRSVYGPVPQEVRTWIVDGRPIAWSFHYLNVVRQPDGFPLANGDVTALRRLAGQVGAAFGSRLVAADFARRVDGRWTFIEAGPGSCAGTAHEQVFKAVAAALAGATTSFVADRHGGRFPADPAIP